MIGARQRTLVRALQVLRSRERLAAALQVSLEELETYLEGEKPLPDRAFMIALDIVATGTDRGNRFS